MDKYITLPVDCDCVKTGSMILIVKLGSEKCLIKWK